MAKEPEAVAVLRGGCGWLMAYNDGRVRCSNPRPCAGPHTIKVEES